MFNYFTFETEDVKQCIWLHSRSNIQRLLSERAYILKMYMHRRQEWKEVEEEVAVK